MPPRAVKKPPNTTSSAPNPEKEERQRLRKLAYKKNIFSVAPSSVDPSAALNPSKTVLKHNGTDILRKSQRKNRYLFSFPGLLGPVSGGKIGDLINLGTKNPILYLDFPQGQMKLFGTIVYPKNRYLTLQFSRGGKNVMCEDYFDNMIVFSDAWWIGRKEDNPEELQLEFPKELSTEKQAECDFKGGAGAACKENNDKCKSKIKHTEQQPAKHESDLEDDDSCDSLKYSNETMDVDKTPTRQSARTAGKTFRFSEGSSGDDIIDDDIDMSEEDEEKVDIKFPISRLDFTESSCKIADIDEGDESKPAVSKQAEKPTKSILKANDASNSNRGPLVQASISTLFKKVENKERGPVEKGTSADGKRSGRKTTRQKLETESEDDIEELSSSTQDTETSDEDFCN